MSPGPVGQIGGLLRQAASGQLKADHDRHRDAAPKQRLLRSPLRQISNSGPDT
eukprot:SAG31_NODE_22353_length_527_cov_1.163551_1_plen_52_part_01